MADAVIVREIAEAPASGWDDPERGTIGWRTLFSGDTTPTADLTSGFAELPAGGALRSHHHEPAEIYLVVQGRGVLTTDDGEREVGAGSAVFVPGGVRHGIRNTAEIPLRFFYVLAAGSFADVEYHF
jgi:mannose-6-phosphate isomerase-like protein (cupin superfamily)